MRTRFLVFLVLVFVGARASAQSHIVVGDIFRLNAGPCSISSVDGSPDKIVLSQCPVLTTGAATSMTLQPTGDLVLAPEGHDILPNVGYTQNLGALANKYLTLHAAELWVETLVAQNTIATIGGRVLVAPTNILTSDLSTIATSITVKYNNLASGARVYLEADGKVEWMAVTSTASGSGPYTYTVTRNLDLSGANAWFAGDAVLNTGTTGSGFIDIFSVAGVLSGAGPTIVGNVRTGTTYSQVAPRWAIGNLDGLFNYGATTFGAAFGDASATNVTIDATNGFRIRSGTTDKLAADTSGNLSLTGDLILGTSSVMRSSSATSLTTGDGFYMSGGATPTFRIGNPAGNRFVYDSGSGTAAFFGDASGATNLNVGAGRNMVRNSDCAVSTSDWTFATGSGLTFSLGFALSPWRLNDESNTCYVTVVGTPTTSTQTAAYLSAPFPVIAGHRYEASAYLGVQRTGNTQVLLQWLDVFGALISNSGGNNCTTASAGGIYLADYCRSGIVATAPVGTVLARPVIQTTHNGGANPFVFFVHNFFGEALTGQTDLTPWGPAGMTTINGGVIETDSITAAKIVAGTITGTKIAAGTITATNISAGTITATQIAGNTITAGNIAAGTITGTEIAASTITAAKLSVTSLSAITADLGTVNAGTVNGVSISGSSISGGTIQIGTGSMFNGLTVASNGVTTVDVIQAGDLNVTGPGAVGIASLAGSGSRVICATSTGFLFASSNGAGCAP